MQEVNLVSDNFVQLSSSVYTCYLITKECVSIRIINFTNSVWNYRFIFMKIYFTANYTFLQKIQHYENLEPYGIIQHFTGLHGCSIRSIQHNVRLFDSYSSLLITQFVFHMKLYCCTALNVPVLFTFVMVHHIQLIYGYTLSYLLGLHCSTATYIVILLLQVQQL